MRLSYWPLLLLIASVGLSACNAAISDHPMFQEAERSSKVVLEDGLWFLVKDDCAVEPAQPTSAWPKCADWVILGGGKAIKSSDSKPQEGPEDVFIADGQPPLIQARIKTNGSDVAYGFLALEPQAFSGAGKITDVKVWMVPCGIDQAPEAATPKVQPYPGFTEDCHPNSVDALRAAASKGPSKITDVVEWKWVRAETP